MIPNAAEVVRRRWTVITIVRFLSLLLALLATMPLVSWLAEGIADGDLLDFGYYSGRILTAVIMLVSAVVGLLAGGLVARIMVPARVSTGCPRCRYRLEGLVGPRCPECGLMLPPEFMGGQTPPERPEPRAVRLVKLRDTMTPIVRLVGAFIVFFYFFAAIGMSVAVVNEPRNGETVVASLWLVHFWLGLVLGLWMFFRGERVAAFLTPKIKPDPAPPSEIPPSPPPAP